MAQYLTGTHTGGIVLSDPTTTQVAGGYITNTTTNHSGDAVYGNTAAAWNITNYGTITIKVAPTSKGTGDGVDLKAGGTVVNAIGALIFGSVYTAGVSIGGGYGKVTNSGTINGGIFLAAGGRVANYANAGNVTIRGPGGSVSNSGTIFGGHFGRAAFVTGVELTAGSVGNSGQIGGGVAITGGAGTVTNSGSIGAGFYGISMASGGVVANTGTGYIGGPTAIVVKGFPGTVANAGTIRGVSGDAISLGVGGVVTNAGLIATGTSGSYDGIRLSARGSVVNTGTIAGAAAGIYLGAGGHILNAAGLISGYIGVSDKRGGTITNAGTIIGRHGTAIAFGTLDGGAMLVIEPGATLIGALAGFRKFDTIDFTGVDPASASVVFSAGTAAGPGTLTILSGTTAAASVALYGNFTTKNFTLSPDGHGGTDIITLGQAPAGPDFSGTYTAGIILSNPATQNPATLLAGGYVTNTYGGDAVYGTDAAAWVFTNLGTIKATGQTGAGVALVAGGSVKNAAGALITGVAYGAQITGAPANIANYGTINATGTFQSAAVSLAAGGYVMNAAGALINGHVFNGSVVPGGNGVNISGAAGVVTNHGTINGGVSIATGSVYNKGSIDSVGVGGGTIANAGTIDHVLMFTGSLTNTGVIGAGVRLIAGGGLVNNTGLIDGGVNSDFTPASNYIKNSGTIRSDGAGVSITFGTVVNSGLIQGFEGVYAFNGLIANFGTIASTSTSGAAVYSRHGSFINQGVVQGSVFGIVLGQTLNSAGTLNSTGVGQVTASGSVSGAIGIGAAPNITAGYTVTVGGTVASTAGSAGKAVSLGGLTGRLIVDPGAAFTGVIDGGGGTSVLEIASSGPASGLADRALAAGPVAYVALGSVTNFSALQIDPSASFEGLGTLSFATLVNQGQINLAAGDSLVIATVASAATGGTIDLKSGGSVEFQGAVAAGQTLLFRPPGGTALIDHPESFSGTISGFTGPSDRMDLTGFGPTGASAALDADDRLVVTNGSQSVSLQLDTALDYTGITWQTGADAAGTGTDVAPVCFCRGTLILTDRGEMPVESLAVGDRVKTLSGTFKPIVWIGFGRELLTVANKLARPVIVRRSALADGVPKRDLYLTHGHALCLNGVLIPVENLVNHRTILWDETARVIEYYHIELEDHDVLLAEGAPAESYYDAGNRALFQNTRPGSAAGGDKPTFAPVLDSGAIVERIWARLFARAGGRFDTATTDDPDLHLVVDGARLDPAAVADGVFAFALRAAPTETLLLRSRRFVPSLLGLSRRDHWPLGVAIRRIVLDHAGIATSFEYDQPQLREGGCYPPEDGFCCTDGEFALPARFFQWLIGPLTLLVHIEPRFRLRYPVAPPHANAA